MAKRCEPLDFVWDRELRTVTGRANVLEYRLEARSPGPGWWRVMGEAQAWVDRDKNRLRVVWIEAYKPGCGYGTAMYEEIYRKACKLGLRMSSDYTLFRESRAFWHKQYRKGRARCLGRGRLHPYSPTTSCEQYEMKKVCPPQFDLSGLKRKKRKRKRKKRSR